MIRLNKSNDMTKLFFKFAAMGSGKSTDLLRSNFNYIEKGMTTLLFLPSIIGSEYIESRIGLKEKANIFNREFDFLKYIELDYRGVSCIFIDEAQFLTKDQVFQLCKVVDICEIPVLCYGLRSDFRGEPFEGSKYLLTLADKLIEIKSICKCGRKATMNLRFTTNEKGDMIPVVNGNQIDIGGNDKYTSMCRNCFTLSYDKE